MTCSPLVCLLLMAVGLLITAGAGWAAITQDQQPKPQSGHSNTTAMAPSSSSSSAIQVKTPDGKVVWYEPEIGSQGASPVYVYSKRLNAEAESTESWWMLGLIGFGFVGQLMFMGRFLLQWIASERAGKSVVPLGFWWFSLIGASILLTYFALRGDPIGVLGQLLGWPIYMRNLYMVYRDRRLGVESAVSLDPAEHPVPDPNAQS